MNSVEHEIVRFLLVVLAIAEALAVIAPKIMHLGEKIAAEAIDAYARLLLKWRAIKLVVAELKKIK